MSTDILEKSVSENESISENEQINGKGMRDENNRMLVDDMDIMLRLDKTKQKTIETKG